MTLDQVTSSKEVPNDIPVIIEIPLHTNPVKHEAHQDLGANTWVKVETRADAAAARTAIRTGVERHPNAKDEPFY